jgi:hypothetical protein
VNTTVRITRLTIGTIFKLVALGTLIPIVGFFLLCGLLALGGMQTVHVNGNAVTGAGGLLAAAIMAPIFWLILTVICWLSMFVGLWLFSLVRPIEISFVLASPASAP